MSGQFQRENGNGLRYHSLLSWRNQRTVRGVYCCGPSEPTKTASRPAVPCGGSVGRRLADRRGARIPEKLGDVSRHYLDAEDEGRHSRRVHLAARGEGVRGPQYAEIDSLRSIELQDQRGRWRDEM